MLFHAPPLLVRERPRLPQNLHGHSYHAEIVQQARQHRFLNAAKPLGVVLQETRDDLGNGDAMVGMTRMMEMMSGQAGMMGSRGGMMDGQGGMMRPPDARSGK